MPTIQNGKKDRSLQAKEAITDISPSREIHQKKIHPNLPVEDTKLKQIKLREEHLEPVENEIIDIGDDVSWWEEYGEYIEWERQFWQYLRENADELFNADGITFIDDDEDPEGYTIYENFEAFLAELEAEEQ